MFNFISNEQNMSIKEKFLTAQRELEAKFNPDSASRFLVKDDASGLFQANALERIDAIIKKPLYRFFWYQDMPVFYGGGALENASFFRMNYSTQDLSGQVASGNANVGQLVKVQIEKMTTRVRPYWWVVGLGFLDQLKYGQIGLDMLGMFDEGVRMHYNRQLDQIAFFGFENVTDSFGLFNNTSITTVEFDDAAVGLTAGVKWEVATPLELLKVFNTQMLASITGMEYDGQFSPNHIICPLDFFAFLSQPMQRAATAGALTVAQSVKNYLELNLATTYAGYNTTPKFFANRYLDGIGTNNAGRIVITHFDENVYRMPLPMDLTRGATVFNAQAMETQTSYVTFIGEAQFIYKTAIRYLDNLGA
jgi:hypothetical protein